MKSLAVLFLSVLVSEALLVSASRLGITFKEEISMELLYLNEMTLQITSLITILSSSNMI